MDCTAWWPFCPWRFRGIRCFFLFDIGSRGSCHGTTTAKFARDVAKNTWKRYIDWISTPIAAYNRAAGTSMKSIRRSNAFVAVGCFNIDHLSLLAQNPERSHKYVGTGAAASMLSNRLSWLYDLKELSLTIDTACFRSMVALNMACQALQNGTFDVTRVTN